MTDNEILKALESCSAGACTEACPQDSYKYHDCMEQLMKNAIDLIKQQQERMDKIIEQLEGMVQYNRDLMLHYSGRRDITVPIGYQTRGIEIAIEAAKFVMKGGAE